MWPNSRAVRDKNMTWFDLSIVFDPLVTEALGALLTDWTKRKRWHDLSPAHRHLHRAILHAYLKSGKPPSNEEMSNLIGGVAGPGLEDLAGRDLIVLDGGEIVGAYPFTSRPSVHRVEIDQNEIAAMCAIDALGAGAMARSDARVRSRCARCNAPIKIDIVEHGLAIRSVKPASALVWAGSVEASGCAADTQCATMLFFCDRTHLEDWRTANSADGVGYCLTPAQALQLGGAIFRPFLAQTDDLEQSK
jgi:mercuric reductase